MQSTTTLFIINFLLLLSSFIQTFPLNSKFKNPSVNGKRSMSLHGYVPPEKDPEYQGMVKKSLLIDEINVNDTFPIPKEGDIVAFDGKWKGETLLGSIRTLRPSFYTNETGWMATVMPLKEGKSENVYCINREAKSILISTKDLSPVKFYYVRSENGFRVTIKQNTTMPSLRAPSYRAVDGSSKPPKKAVNLKTLEADMTDYGELKKRIQLITLQVGALISIPVTLAFDLETGLTYLVGVSFSVLYLFLLGKETDNIGLDFSSRVVESDSNGIKRLAKLRLATPAMLIGLLALFNYVTNRELIQPLSIVKKSQYLAAISGFLTYRISLFVSEILPDLKIDDVMGILPGSIAEGYRQLKSVNITSTGSPIKTIKTVFVTGPQAAGREFIVDDIYERVSKVSRKLKRWKAFTNDFQLVDRFPSRYDYIDETTMIDLRRSNSLIFETSQHNAQVAWSAIGLSEDCIYLLEGPPQLLDGLIRLESIESTNIWLTALTREQFLEGAKKISPAKYDEVMDATIADISYYKQRASKFRKTLLSSWFDEESVSTYEIEKILESKNNN